MRRTVVIVPLLAAALGIPASASARTGVFKPDLHSAWLKPLGLNCSTPGRGAELLFPVSQVTVAGHRDTVVAADCVTGDSSAFSTVAVFSGTNPKAHPHRLATLLSPSSTWLPTRGVKVESVRVRSGEVTVTGVGYSSPNLCNACEDRSVTRTYRFHAGRAVLGSSAVTVLRG